MKHMHRMAIGLGSFLAVIAIGLSLASPRAPALDQAALRELAAWVASNQTVLARAAARAPGSTTARPPAALADRFAEIGRDRHANPWLRLAEVPAGITAGIVRRESATAPLILDGDEPPDLTIRLGEGPWWYYQFATRAAAGPEAPKP
jgi:hypothetical protein